MRRPAYVPDHYVRAAQELRGKRQRLRVFALSVIAALGLLIGAAAMIAVLSAAGGAPPACHDPACGWQMPTTYGPPPTP